VDGVLKVGLVGFGSVARVHMNAYQDLPRIRVVAVVDTDPVKVAEVKRKYDVPGYAALEDMLGQVELDIVCVCTPPATHESVVCQCAAAKVHILCEKPLALSIEACERMIKACQENDVRLCYGASYRYLPAITVARKLILEGGIGTVQLLREQLVGGRGPEGRDTLSFEHYPRLGPGGSGMGLCDHGIHLIDTFAWLADSHATRAWGRGNVSGEAQQPEFLHVQYDNGAAGHLLYEDGSFSTDLPQEGIFGWASGWGISGAQAEDARSGSWQAHPSSIHVHGSRGSLRIFYYANALFWRDAGGVRQVTVPNRPVPANFAVQLDSFAQAIGAGLPTPVPGEVGLEACRTLLAAYAGRAVTLPGPVVGAFAGRVDGR
jgi:predicted dehydrogenase